MEKLKFTLFSIVVLALVGLLGYWAITTLQSGSEHVNTEKLKSLEKENAELEKETADLKNQLSAFQPIAETSEQNTEPAEQNPVAPATVYKYQDLINALQQLIDDNVTMKLKSRGTRVGTIQQFLNIYNNTTNKIDNDFGDSTKKAIIAFQKAEGLTASGEAGQATFSKMIDWLKKQG